MSQYSQEAICLIPAPSGGRIPVNCKQMFAKACCSQYLALPQHFDVGHALSKSAQDQRGDCNPQARCGMGRVHNLSEGTRQGEMFHHGMER